MIMSSTFDSLEIEPWHFVEYCENRILDLEEAYLRLYKLKIKKDVKIILKSDEPFLDCFEAHKLILAEKSQFFEDMFCNTENTTPEVIIVDGVTARSLELLLWYIYNDNLERTIPDELVEVANAAQRFEVRGLFTQCKRQLFKHPVNMDTVFYVLKASNYFGMEATQAKCMRFINIAPKNVIFKAPGYLKLSKCSVYNILEQCDISGCEFDFLVGVIQWLNHNQPRGRGLLSQINILALTCEEFVDLIEKFPNFFTRQERNSILYNFFRPGFIDLPSWCQHFSDDFASYSVNYDVVVSMCLQVETDCNRSFGRWHLFSGDGFRESVVFEVKLSKPFPERSNLAMFKLAFGSDYVPEHHLEVQLFRLEAGVGTLEWKAEVEFTLHVTSDHYYIIPNSRLRVMRNYPLVFSLKLRVNGLRAWGADSPVSNGQYRVTQVPQDMFYNMRLNAFGHGSVCVTSLSDWLLFLDPVRGEKKFVISSFYFDCENKL